MTVIENLRVVEMSRYSSSHSLRDTQSSSRRHFSGYSRRDQNSHDRSRSPPSRSCEIVHLHGVAAEILTSDKEVERLKEIYHDVNIGRELSGEILKMSFSGPARNVYDFMMALHRYLENTKRINCPR